MGESLVTMPWFTCVFITALGMSINTAFGQGSQTKGDRDKALYYGDEVKERPQIVPNAGKKSWVNVGLHLPAGSLQYFRFHLHLDNCTAPCHLWLEIWHENTDGTFLLTWQKLITFSPQSQHTGIYWFPDDNGLELPVANGDLLGWTDETEHGLVSFSYHQTPGQPAGYRSRGFSHDDMPEVNTSYSFGFLAVPVHFSFGAVIKPSYLSINTKKIFNWTSSHSTVKPSPDNNSTSRAYRIYQRLTTDCFISYLILIVYPLCIIR